MALWTEIVSPAELTGFSRVEQEATDTGVYSTIMPNLFQDDVKFTWKVDSILSDVAEFGEFDTEAPLGKSVGREEKTVRLLPVMKKLRLSEYEQIIEPDRVQAKADEKAAALVSFINNRLSRARAEALVTGKLTINENKLKVTVNFARKSTHTDAAPTALWSAAGAKPIEDLQKWRDMIQDETGATPDTIIMSTRIYNAIGAAFVAAGWLDRISREGVNAVFADSDLPGFTIDNSRIGGQRLVADDRLIMAVGGGVSGRTVFAPTVESQDPRYGLAGGNRSGVIAGLYREDDPPVQWVLGKAVALPILSNPNTTLSADVL